MENKEPKMNYYYTNIYANNDERLDAISADILIEYPRLGYLARKAAQMETPFGPAHMDCEKFSSQENEINRLINIIIITEGNQEFKGEYAKACRDFVEACESWRSNFTYSNPEEMPAYLVYEVYKTHKLNNSIPLITYEQASAICRRKKRDQELKDKADIFRSQYPSLGAVADEVIKYESDSGIWLRFQENDLVRLVTALKLIEGKEEYKDLFASLLDELTKKYAEWVNTESHIKLPQIEIVIEMMDRLKRHLDGDEIPISTYADILNEQKKQQPGSGELKF